MGPLDAILPRTSGQICHVRARKTLHVGLRRTFLVDSGRYGSLQIQRPSHSRYITDTHKRQAAAGAANAGTGGASGSMDSMDEGEGHPWRGTEELAFRVETATLQIERAADMREASLSLLGLLSAPEHFNPAKPRPLSQASQ